ncbi:MAG: glycosyl hydrolase family 28 protein [Planctomycetota bacterium]|nr:glycosyl hydrolase family 28 protein [Planctomycetota bacterium]
MSSTVRCSTSRLRLAGALLALTAALLTGCKNPAVTSAEHPTTQPGAATMSTPAPDPSKISPLYTVTVNGKPVPVLACLTTRITDEQGKLMADRHQTEQRMPGAICAFDFKGSATVEVTVLGPALHLPLKTVTVRPLRRNIKSSIEGSTLRFQLKEACQLSIEPNDAILAPLMFFANAPEENGVKPAAPKPIAGAAPSAGGALEAPGLIYYPPGVHEMGVRRLESNTTLYLAEGAVVHGRVEAENAANVRILGRGILDGSKIKLENAGRGIRLFKCRDVLIDGIMLIDTASWGIEINHCDHVRVHNVKALSGRGSGDGVDVCSSEDVSVDECFFRTHDDSMNVKGLTDLGYPGGKDGKQWSSDGVRKPARNIRFTRCVVWNDRAHALMMGPETRTTEICDVLWKDIDVIHALSVHAMAIFSGDAAEIHDIRYENIVVEDARVMEFIGIRVGPTYTTADPQRGGVRNVTYCNVRSLTPGSHSVLATDDPHGPISRITFDKLFFAKEQVLDEKTMLLHKRGSVTEVNWR